MLSVGRLKHEYVYARATSIILCLKQIIKQLLMYNHNKLDISLHRSYNFNRRDGEEEEEVKEGINKWYHASFIAQ